MKKTYKCFGEALDILRVENDLSYDRLSLKLGIANSYVYHMINRRTKSAPSDEILTKIANFFGLEPEYFFEYRIRKMIKFIEENKEFLDHCEKEKSRWLKKELEEPPTLPESKKESTKSKKESKVDQPVK
ncbi:MAG: helix-turn-helix domain-containing protein [Candidatus Humimicrobiaceae bacterium]